MVTSNNKSYERKNIKEPYMDSEPDIRAKKNIFMPSLHSSWL